MDKIHIFFNINDIYAKFMSVTILSIIKHLSKNYLPSFHVLTDYVSENNQSLINELKKIRYFEIEYISIDNERVRQFPLFSRSQGGESNYRLLMHEIRPDLKKAIYLDVDLIVLDDLAKIWVLDMDNHAILAVLDSLLTSRRTKKFLLSINFNIDKYFNSGLFLANFQKWREMGASALITAAAEKYSQNMRYPDQDLLNIVFNENLDILPFEWNFIPFIEHEYPVRVHSPKVIHFSSYYKPWNNPGYKYANFFWDYARQTPFYRAILNEVNIASPQELLRSEKNIKKYSLYLKVPFINKNKYLKKRNKARILLDNAKWFQEHNS